MCVPRVTVARGMREGMRKGGCGSIGIIGFEHSLEINWLRTKSRTELTCSATQLIATHSAIKRYRILSYPQDEQHKVETLIVLGSTADCQSLTPLFTIESGVPAIATFSPRVFGRQTQIIIKLFPYFQVNARRGSIS
jgi:hypothetical protein